MKKIIILIFILFTNNVFANQDEIKKQLDLKKYRSRPDPWKTNYNSVDNYILGCYSKFQLTKMIEKTNNNYDYIIFMRPDCCYKEKFKLDFLNGIDDNSIVIPKFASWGKYKVNDRFSITNMSTYKIYGNIFSKLLEISKKQMLHSETILGEILHRNKIKIVRIDFFFARIRNDGKTAKLDIKKK